MKQPATQLAAGGPRPGAGGAGAGGADAKRRRAEASAPRIEWCASAAHAPVRGGEPLWDFGQPGAAPAPAPAAPPPPPSPAAELHRARLMARLRGRYAEACREVLALERPPPDSLDRWMLEQLAQARPAADPLLPLPGLAETSRVLLRELLAEVPLRCPTRAWGPPAQRALEQYRRSAQRWLELLGAPGALRAEVEALGAWLDGRGAAAPRRGPEECPFRRKLHELAGAGGLSSRFHLEVEPLALKVVGAVSAEARAVVEELRGVADSGGGDGAPVLLEEEEAATEAVVVRFGDDGLRLSRMHLLKLRGLYEAQHPRAGGPESGAEWEAAFLRHLYVMLRRYVTFIGLDPAEEGSRGGNMHAAAPESVFAWLRRELGAGCELFASPLNCYFPRFFSAFPDTDAAFGSLGSFFRAAALPEGSYEVGPPYTEELLELTARGLLRHLGAAGGPALSFALFVPDWAGCGGLELLDGGAAAAFRRPRGGAPFLLARGREHRYVSGVQFFADVGADAARRYYVVPHGTRVYVLQSEAGAARWPFTEERRRGLLEAMRSGPLP